MKIDSSLEINGEFPPIEQRELTRLICEQFWYDGELKDSANVVHLYVDNHWFRLYFDCGIIFWREQSAAPEPYSYLDNTATKVEFRLHNLLTEIGVESCLIVSVEASEISGGSMVKIALSSGTVIEFKDVADVSSYSTQQIA